MRAQPQDAGRPDGPIHLPLLDSAEHEVLRPDADAIAVPETLGCLHRFPVDPHAIAASEILDLHLVPFDMNESVAARHERVFDRDRALVAAADVGDALLEVDFLEVKSQSVARHELLPLDAGEPTEQKAVLFCVARSWAADTKCRAININGPHVTSPLLERPPAHERIALYERIAYSERRSIFARKFGRGATSILAAP